MKFRGFICYGDSNTYGFDPRSFLGERYEAENRWCDILSRKLRCRIINLGQNGRPVPSGKVRTLERIAEENPDCDCIMVMLGTNDVLLGQSPGHIADKMENLIFQLKVLRKEIILLSPPKIKLEPELDKKITELSILYEKLAEKEKIHFCNCFSWDLELCFDGVHMSEKANHEFAEKLSEFIYRI